MTNKKIPNIVSIGGGTGQAQLLAGLKAYTCNLTAIVTVTDAGRSSGRIRKEMKVLPPGDIRNCLVALSDSEKLLLDLFQYRFTNKPLKGHSFGNLFIAALSKIAGSFEKSIQETSKILSIKGKVIPSTLANTDIWATLTDGTVCKGEVDVRRLNKPSIKESFLKPKNAKATPAAIEAIFNADLIVIGPGSLYTSVITNLLIKDLREAIVKSKAKKVYICNIMTQPGQTDGYSADDHIRTIIKYTGRNILDYVIVNNDIPSKGAIRAYEEDKAFLLNPPSSKDFKKYKFDLISGKLIEKDIRKKKLWQKQHLLRHNSDKIAKILIGLTNPRLKAVILAAGEGTRLAPFSFSESKTMVKFLGKPLLAHHVDEFIKNGIEDITIVCNKTHYNHIKGYFDRNYQQDLKYVIQEEQKGPAHAINCAAQYLRGGYFIYKYGDSIAFGDEVAEVLKKFKNIKKADGIVTLMKVDDPSEFSSARFENGVLKEIIEKPKDNFPSNLSQVGLGLLNSEKFFEAYKNVAAKNILPPPEYILRRKGHLLYWVSRCERRDMGRVWNILEVNKLLLKKLGPRIETTHVSPLAHIDKRTYIGPNAIIREDVYINGYSSIDCFVDRGSIISDSVLMEGSRIGKNCYIISSVIGKNNLIEDNFKVFTKQEKVKIYVKGRYAQPDFQYLGCFTGDNVTIMENIIAAPGKMVFPNKVVSKNINNDLLIRAVLFDADNTLYKTREVAKNADMEAMCFFSTKCNAPAGCLYKDWKGIVARLSMSKKPPQRHRKYSYSILAKKYRIYNSNNIDEAFNRFIIRLKKDIRLMPGFKTILPYLQKYKLAVITEDSRDLTNAKLEALGLSKSFQEVLTSDDVGAMKPEIAYYKKIFTKFKVSPAECLVVGDDYQKDLAIPKKLGATVVCLGESQEANYSIKHYSELLRILGEI